jgi:hypothetical protein
MKSVFQILAKRFWSFGMTIGIAVSFAVTFFMTSWEWIANPGGIFRDSNGTHWQFVYDTAISWLIPTFLYSAVAAAIVHLSFSSRRAARQARSNKNGPNRN